MCVRACDKEWECDSEKTSNRKTRSGWMDGNGAHFLLFEPLYVLDHSWTAKAKVKVLILFVSPEQILGCSFRIGCPDVKNPKEIWGMRERIKIRWKSGNKGMQSNNELASVRVRLPTAPSACLRLSAQNLLRLSLCTYAIRLSADKYPFSSSALWIKTTSGLGC